MSFYGNISNISRTQFRFERTYPNRKVMDASAATDGVYVGNYVLVDYDTQLSGDWGYTPCYAYRNSENADIIEFYDRPKEENGVRITYNQLKVSSILYPWAHEQQQYFKYLIVPHNLVTVDSNNGTRTTVIYNHIDSELGADITEYFEVIGHIGESQDNNSWYPLVRKLVVTGENTDSPYAVNFVMDAEYKSPRGYDSTVWQKVYTGSPATARYVMIAELNTVVPTFDVSAEAPTLSPIMPHFDLSSTNFYYKLHWQPSWGLRVKSAININSSTMLSAGLGQSTGDAVNLNFNPIRATALPSDELIEWTRPFYDKATGVTDTYQYVYSSISSDKLTYYGGWHVGNDEVYSKIPGAIYYNKAGFDSRISTHSNGIKDEITITPSGLSGAEYNLHGARYVLYGNQHLIAPQETPDGTETAIDAINRINNELRENCVQTYASDQVWDANTNTYHDLYGRDCLYKVEDNQYVQATAYENGVEYYIKSTNVGVGEMMPQVDTQEISIMLPSIGDTVASMWDLMYGDTSVNRSIYRNRTIKWLDGTTYFRDNGLRLMPTHVHGLGYEPNAVNTLAGAINSVHDLMGMIIKKMDGTLEAWLQAGNSIDDLPSSYIYYFTGDRTYYRKGLSYVWNDDANSIITRYDKSQKWEEPYAMAVESSETLMAWPEPNDTYYYLEPVEGTIAGEPVIKYNYILDPTYHGGWKYATISDLPVDPDDVVEVGRQFQERIYHQFLANDDISYSENGNLITVQCDKFVLSSDTAYDPTHRYYSINLEAFVDDNNVTHPIDFTYLSDASNFFEYDPNDITKQFYNVTAWGLAQETNTEGNLVPITENTFNINPAKYYVGIEDLSTDSGWTSNLEQTQTFDPNITYVVPTGFEAVSDSDDIQPQMFTIQAKSTSTSQYYIQQINYVPYGANEVTSANFSQKVVYIFQNGEYIIADHYEPNVQYYKKRVSWKLTTRPSEITADNATLVRVLNPYLTVDVGNGEERPRYYYYNSAGTSGTGEFYGINDAIANKFTFPIVEITPHEVTGFYEPGTLYYRIHENPPGPYEGSWILDTNEEPIAGRTYYNFVAHHIVDDKKVACDTDPLGTEGTNVELVDMKFFTSAGKIYSLDNLNAPTFVENEGITYSYSNLFVYENEDENVPLKVGDKWNMDISLDANNNPDNKIKLARMTTMPTLFKLDGFGRSMNTMHGAIIRVDEMLSADDYNTRSRQTVTGALNCMNDIIDVFEDISADEPVMADQYGQLYTRGIVLNNSQSWAAQPTGLQQQDYYDPWVNLTEERHLDQKNWHFGVHHKPLAADQLLNHGADTSIHNKIWGYTSANPTQAQFEATPEKYYELIRGQYTRSTGWANDKNYYILNAALINGNTRTEVTIDGTQTQTPLFGQTFNIISEVVQDTSGHIHNYKVDTVKIPLPSLTEKLGLNSSSADILTEDNPWNDWNVMMGIELDPTAAAITYRRHNVADLKLHDYTNTDTSNDAVAAMNAGHIITSANTINEAFAALETYIWNSDVQDVFAPTASNNANKLDNNSTTANIANWYITNLTETDGRINYSLTRLINTSSDVVLRSTNATKGQTAVSAHAVRESINDLDVADKCAPNATNNSNNIVNWYITNLSETDGLIDYGFTQLINTSSDVVSSATGANDVRYQTAVSAKAVRDTINDLDVADKCNSNVNQYITQLSETDGLIDYGFTTLINTSSDIVDDNTNKAKTAVSGQAVRQAINDLDYNSQFATTTLANNNEYIVGLTQTDGIIAYTVATLLNDPSDITVNANNAVSGKGVRNVINTLDVATQFTGHEHENNYYITELTETDGKIAYTLTQLLNTDGAITSSAYGAVSGVGVRAVIDALNVSTSFSNDNEYITALTETSGKISYTVTTLLNTNDAITSSANGAVSGKGVRSVIDALDSSQSVVDTANTAAAYMTGITETDGKLTGYTQGTFISDIAGTSNSIIAPTTQAVVTYVGNQLSTYGGSSSITTVGTIGTGEWGGTVIGVTHGGTGTTTAPTANGVIYAASASGYASTAAGTDGQFLKGVTDGAPVWAIPTLGNIATTTSIINEITANVVPGSSPATAFSSVNDYSLTTNDSLINILCRMYNHIQNLESRLATLEGLVATYHPTEP